MNFEYFFFQGVERVGSTDTKNTWLKPKATTKAEYDVYTGRSTTKWDPPSNLKPN